MSVNNSTEVHVQPRCSEQRRAIGLPYSRSCWLCGVGPCQNPPTDDPNLHTTRPMPLVSFGAASFTYQNHRGEKRRRRAIFHSLFYGRTPYHRDQDQWFVNATDLERPEEDSQRQFALSKMEDVVYEP